jgi:UDP-N-acetylglucosamine--dolichyl-phosphate N-acetylglucosaminephosphotransferase
LDILSVYRKEAGYMIFTNDIYKLVLVFMYSAVATWAVLPYVMNRCVKFGYVVKDMHKTGKPLIPVLGGIAIWVGVLVSLALTQLLFLSKSSFPLGNLFIFYFIVVIYAMYGLLDDIFHFKQRYDKVLTLVVLSIPIASLITSTNISFGFFSFDPGLVYLLVLAPIYIMVVANLINLHAGFNGLGPGTTLVMMVAAGIKSYMMFGWTHLIYLMPILGGVLVFFMYNKYPAKVFDGNVGAFLMGSALGAFLMVNNLFVFGIFILIPHIVTFMLDTYVLTLRKKKDVEFPIPRKDGLIVPPKGMQYKSLKNVLCTWFKLTEKQAAWLLIDLTGLFCLVGIIFF